MIESAENLNFEKAAEIRDEIKKLEKDEIGIIQTFLPEQISDADLSSLVEEIIKETGAESIKDMGKVMGALKPKIVGKADPGFASSIVKKLLS